RRVSFFNDCLFLDRRPASTTLNRSNNFNPLTAFWKLVSTIIIHSHTPKSRSRPSCPVPKGCSPCTSVRWNGSTANVKLPDGYTGGQNISGAVYTAIDDGSILWVSMVDF